MLDRPKYSFHSFYHLYRVGCVVHGFSACDACFWGFAENDVLLVKMTCDGQMPQFNDGSGSSVVV
jgi:hypothetical protein